MRAVHWFRNDLRLHDNTGLAVAASRADELTTVFILDPHLLSKSGEPRTSFLLDCLQRLAWDLEKRSAGFIIRTGDPCREIPRLIQETKADLLTYNRDYSPYAARRDARVAHAARKLGAQVIDCKDRVVFESNELRTGSGSAYVVYTPYRRKWRDALRTVHLDTPVALRLPKAIEGLRGEKLPGPPKCGAALPAGGEAAARRRLRTFFDGEAAGYAMRRDVLAVDGTSQLSPYLRFGALSVRECVRRARSSRGAGVSKWLDQLIWRDFYTAILAEHPHVLRRAFRREYDGIEWNEDDEGFAAWCAGRTGYPIVDAGMRQLLQTGWMHNRARMIVASFLVKDLLIDWRRGEAFFMEHLVDGDPANNNGGWQWSASTGTDAQPYFRIFNPSSQGERFDKKGEYVRRYVPELEGVPLRYIHRPWEAPQPPAGYPAPIVDHGERRTVAIARFAAARDAAKGKQ
jgi:deoxyribodipyrimidine photo-lyase